MHTTRRRSRNRFGQGWTQIVAVKNLKIRTILGSVFGPIFWSCFGALQYRCQLKWAPFLGPCFGTPENNFFRQVSASWTVWNLAEQRARNSGFRVLRCNVDETMLPRGLGDQKGVVVRRRPKEQPGAPRGQGGASADSPATKHSK